MALAVIFDVDGLMLDTERIARSSWRKAMADRGFNMEDPVFMRTVGRTVRDTERILKAEFGEDFPFDQIFASRQAYYDQELQENGVPVKPGLIDLLVYLQQNQVQRAVATSAHREFAYKKLGGANLLRYFQVIVTIDDVKKGKPAPDLFLEAARQLGTAPQECVVLEDSEAGIRAAHAAGMVPLMIPDLKQPEPEVAALAKHILSSLNDVIEVIRNY